MNKRSPIAIAAAAAISTSPPVSAALGFDGTPRVVCSRTPDSGSHTQVTLHALGYPDDRVATLVSSAAS